MNPVFLIYLTEPQYNVRVTVNLMELRDGYEPMTLKKKINSKGDSF